MSNKHTDLDFLESLLNLSVDCKTTRIKNRESDHREFKREFDSKNIPKYAKTMVAFANRDGGVLFFGIKDHPREIIGEIEKNIPNDLVFSHFLKEYFEPEVIFRSETITLCDKLIHAIVVKRSIKKPIICKKEKKIKATEKGQRDSIILREGAVYYRYSSSTEEIKYAELKSLLDEQVSHVFHSLVDNITLLQKVGYDKAAVVNAEDISGDNKIASVYMTNETAKNMNWIRHGHFVEDPNDGDNAFYVTRQVEIKHGVEVCKPTDFNTTHPLTKTELTKRVKISSNYIDAVAWKLGVLNNPIFHVSVSHGKNKNHKFTITAMEKILESYPLDIGVAERRKMFKNAVSEYQKRQIIE